MRRALPIVFVACGGAQTEPAQPTPIPLASSDPDCGVESYVLHAAPTGPKPPLPAPPPPNDAPKRIGDAYTVYGAVRQLHLDPSPFARDVAIVGVIVDTNIDRAPACAKHKTGKADPPGCVTEIPTFRIADKQGDAQSIPVMGWASNFANVWEAQQAKEKRWDDGNWAVRVPWPMPAVGTKVKVTGRYAQVFTQSSTGMASEPRTGILTYASMETLP